MLTQLESNKIYVREIVLLAVNNILKVRSKSKED